jgi:hypothetical protein
VIQVRSLSTVGNMGNYVMTKQSGEWLVVSFTHVEYELSPKKTGIRAGKKPAASK